MSSVFSFRVSVVSFLDDVCSDGVGGGVSFFLS